MTILKSSIYASFTYLILPVCFVLMTITAHGAFAQDHQNETKTTSSVWSFPIQFFQKSISRADGNRCPMYPSCSHYASEAFKRHGPLKGFILTCDRLLRCGHDEVRLSPKVRIKRRLYTYDPLKNNTRWWSNP